MEISDQAGERAAPTTTPSPPRVLVLGGANLDQLGRREPDVYGTVTLAGIESLARRTGERLGLEIDFRQSNHEGVLVEAVHEALDTCAAVIVNPAGYTHTSVVLRDALAMMTGPVIEVHLSNVHRREPFRAHSYISAVATAVIAGAGADGYRLALEHVAHLLAASPSTT